MMAKGPNMSTPIVRRRALEIALISCLILLGWLIHSAATLDKPGRTPERQNSDIETHISRIHLDLTSPNHWVRLYWSGRDAAKQDAGPFRSSPGAGWGDNDCNDQVESNRNGSYCTPKGLRKVEGFRDSLWTHPECRFVTYIDFNRDISFHSHPSVPSVPSSQGCVRLEPYAARLIHDNSIVGKTEILIDGTWTNPDSGRERSPSAAKNQGT
jgi:hypothetical protein